jgi:hypothetical protein
LFRIAMLALSLATPASYERLPDHDGCAASIEAIHETFGNVGEANDGLGFLLRQIRPDGDHVSVAVTQAELLIDDGQRQLDVLLAACGSAVVDRTTDLRGLLEDLRGYMEVGLLALPQEDHRHPVWRQRRELEKSREAARAEFARMRARQSAQ